MSITSVIGNGLSGLVANQFVLRNVSDNIANVNTPGYVRKDVALQSRTIGGVGSGVEVASIERAADKFLQAASVTATAKYAEDEYIANVMDRLQASFGDPSEPSSLFARMNDLFGQFGIASTDSSSLTIRESIIGDLSDLLSEFHRHYNEIQSIRGDADLQIVTGVARINEILTEVSRLNAEILKTNVVGGDSSGAEGQQDQLLNELATYMDLRIEHTPRSGVIVRTTDGILLAGEEAAELSYTSRGRVTAASSFDDLAILSPNGVQPEDFPGHILSGEFRALIDIRDHDLVEISNALGDLAGQLADEINAVHANNISVPAPQTLTGRITGLLGTDALNFTGSTTLAIADADGLLVRQVDVDFDAGTYSVNGGAAVSLGATPTVGSFVTSLNTALGADGTASFSNGVLTVSAASANNGLGFVQSETAPSDRGGRGFAHFFGLNELITSTRPVFFETGLSATDSHGFTAGQDINFTVYNERGGVLRDYTYTTSGTTIADILTDLNDVTNGLGSFMTFTLGADGKMSVDNTAAYPKVRLGVQSDETDRGGTGVGFTQIFGVGTAPLASRAQSLAIRNDIASDGNRLSLAQLNITTSTTIGGRVLSPGDGRGALALQAAMSSRTLRGVPLSETASAFAGDIGRRAAAKINSFETALAVRNEISSRRSSVEGVNLDEELVKLTVHQQAYAANARLIQAAGELFDTLLQTV